MSLLTSEPTKVHRDAFLYLDGEHPSFAQCGTCWLWDASKKRCNVLGDMFVQATDSCGYWGRGPYDPNVKNTKRFNPKEVGFVSRQVRCENCRFFGQGTCGLFEKLNNAFSSIFELDTKVKARGCCNAQDPK